MLRAGLAWPARSVREGLLDWSLQEAARSHAEYQARVGVQGHQNFSQRYARLSPLFPGLEITEIAAEGWSHNVTEPDAAKEMYNSWRQSSGHWQAANGPAKYIGYSMARGRSRDTGQMTWYACGLVAR